MKGPHSEWMQAYLDGELSTQDRENFEKDLSSQQKEALQIEAHFNSTLDKRLGKTDINCPDELWQSLQQKLLANKAPQIREVSNFENLKPTLFKMVAICLVAIALNFFFSTNHTKNQQGLNFDPSIKVQLSHVQNLLNEQGYQLKFKNIPIAHHKINFSGMDWVEADLSAESKAARLLFHCCDIPVVIYIKKAHSAPSTPLKTEREHRNLLYHSKKGNEQVLIDAYSNHPPAEVLDLIY